MGPNAPAETVDFEGREVDEATFLEALDDAVAALDEADIPYKVYCFGDECAGDETLRRSASMAMQGHL